VRNQKLELKEMLALRGKSDTPIRGTLRRAAVSVSRGSFHRNQIAAVAAPATPAPMKL
jgi:hypothetical protein